jgi:uncharacterized protein (TIGR00251 family)
MVVIATTLARVGLHVNVGQDANTMGESESCRIRVRLTPRAKQAQIGAPRADGVVPVRVTAPPVDGKANAALCRLIADRLGVARSRVEVVQGQTSRDKVVAVEGLDEASAMAHLNPSATQ